MANQEQLDILKQGVVVWNEWRKKNLGVGADLKLCQFAHYRPALCYPQRC